MSLQLVTGPSESITLVEAKLHLRVENSDDDSLISVLISAAREDCEHQLGRGIGSQTWRRTLDAFPSGGIELGMPPVSAVSSVQYVDPDGMLQNLSAGLYVLDDRSDLEAWLLPAEGTDWPDTQDTANAVTVTFVCGLTTVPSTVRAWMLLRIGTLYQHRAEFVAGQSVAALPHDFSARLLDRYRVPSI